MTVNEILNMSTFNRNAFLLTRGKLIKVIELDGEAYYKFDYNGNIYTIIFDEDDKCIGGFVKTSNDKLTF